ncbi:transposase DNA-binding-containing protein [Acaryochloris sp. IP29b_bin.137]
MQTWAAQELGTSNLGDARLNRRLIEIVDSRQVECSA